MGTISFHSGAIDDLKNALEYYKDISHGLLGRFKAEFEIRLHVISQSPKIFQKTRKNIRKCKMNKFPFHIIFQEYDEFILILAIAHFKRNPGYWKKRKLND